MKNNANIKFKLLLLKTASNTNYLMLSRQPYFEHILPLVKKSY